MPSNCDYGSEGWGFEDLLLDVETSSIQPGLRLDLANKLEAALKALAKSPPDVVLACEKVDATQLSRSRAPHKRQGRPVDSPDAGEVADLLG